MKENNLFTAKPIKESMPREKMKTLQQELAKDFPEAREGLAPLDLTLDEEEAKKEVAFFKRKGYSTVKIRETEHDTHLIVGKK